MSLVLLGDACACIPDGNGKNSYRKIGTAFKDSRGKVCFKIDTLPLPGSGWEGWVNVFERTAKPANSQPDIPDADIPF